MRAFVRACVCGVVCAYLCLGACVCLHYMSVSVCNAIDNTVEI